MAKLNVTIDYLNKKASFTGPGTFECKEQIKQLGNARWNSLNKSWDVFEFTKKADELAEIFVDLDILELGQVDERTEKNSGEGEPHVSMPQSYTVSELINRAREALKAMFPTVTYVCGKISNVKTSNGRVFIELSDLDHEDERISCVIWREADKICQPLTKAGFQLENNLQVMFRVLVEVNKRDARISLNVTGVVAEYTVAKLQALREQTNQRLKDEGIFANNKSKELPFLPQRLGILTSAAGTVINDFMSALNEANFGFELFWVKVDVQGVGAAKKVRAGLKRLQRLPDLDAVLIFRGGGSPAELAVFNDYELAKDVCLFPLPIIAAIGHQEDQCSVQDVSFKACGVPKDLGHFLAGIIHELRQSLAKNSKAIRQAIENKLLLWEQRVVLFSRALGHSLDTLITSRESEVKRVLKTFPLLAAGLVNRKALILNTTLAPISSRAQGLLVLKYRTLAHNRDNITMSVQARYEKAHDALRQVAHRVTRETVRTEQMWKQKVDGWAAIVQGASPEVQLKRGFALVRNPTSGRLITKGLELKKDDLVNIVFSDVEKTAIIK